MAAVRWMHCLGALLVALTLVGCGAQSDVAQRQETTHLRSLVSLYRHAASTLGRPPADEVEFKDFIRNKAKAMVDALKIANVDELFVSERDGQPFVVLYGRRPPEVAPDLVAYERTGVAGKRYVGYSLGVVQEVDEQRFAELVPESSRPDEQQ